MKSIDVSTANSQGMTNKPIITCTGDWNLFCTLEAPLVAAIPQDSCEWRRSYGRVTKSVTLEATFIKYDKDNLQVDNSWNLLKRPVFHVYWTDCVDIEYYKTTLKDDIESWLKQLELKHITDWMIVHVETYDIRKTNKLLPRTTVLDKIKGEFAVKLTEDRFVSVINPIKSEARSADSWRNLVAKIRHFILVSYNKSLQSFEEFMREQRERRNDPEWDFSKYFILQEQLAFVLEMLSLHEEALIQYDELDALFSQFILNSKVTGCPKWLETFKQPITAWHAIRLTVLVPQHIRELIIKKKATLLDFRNYLFQRQSAMLLLTYKPWEIASRCLTLVHNTMRELTILSINVPEGAATCWALLACTETLNACDSVQTNDPNTQELCTAQQAPLLHYAKDKLHVLGKLCSLLPGSPEPTSDQLHLVLTLSTGCGDSDSNERTPTDRLKEALCTKNSFKQYYLELAELAMGTYKHVGRLRFARLIGRELASFYSELGETSKAIVFLMDALRSYEEQGWMELAAQTRLELVACAKKMNDFHRYAKLSATIASSVELEILVRKFYFQEMIQCIKNDLKNSEIVLAELSDCFKLISCTLLPCSRDYYITDSSVQCCLVLESLLPNDVLCSSSKISLETVKEEVKTQKSKTDVNSVNSTPKKHSAGDVQEFVTSLKLDEKPKTSLIPLKITSQLHYKEDKTLQKASIECANPKMTLKRSDSSKYRKPVPTVKSDYTNTFTKNHFTIIPGVNEIVLEHIPVKRGKYNLNQISILLEDKLEYLSNMLSGKQLGFVANEQGVSVLLNKVEPKKDLVAGLEHEMELVVTCGSSDIEQDTSITLKSSNGLLIREEKANSVMSRELTLSIGACKAFGTVSVPLKLYANLQTKNKDKSIEHMVWLTCPWWDSPIEVPLHFTPPMLASWRLLTSNTRKFIQVTMKTTVAHPIQFVLSGAKMICDGNEVSDLNPGSTEFRVSSDGTNSSFLWELLKDPLVASGPIKAKFTVQYQTNHRDQSRNFTCPFEIQDCSTLFVVKKKLEPSKGSDFCRANQMCVLQLSVQRVNETEYTSLMYEVLADQSMWAILGRTAGVITMDTVSVEPQSVTLDVMPLVAGHLPLPTVRLSKYIPANTKDPKKDISAHPRLEPFSPGQVYHAGKALQVHILPCAPKETIDGV